MKVELLYGVTANLNRYFSQIAHEMGPRYRGDEWVLDSIL